MNEVGSEGEDLVEIVPNFSEGRRPEVIEAIVAALQVPGALLLNRQADRDHNRLDCTLVGAPDAVRRSALASAAKAIELIDMDQHRGSHPRMGAVDVIPFVPVRGVTMDDCVALARETAREIADTLSVPVYCYDRAAFTPERVSLADVRRGQYEGLKADVAAGKRLPDFGPNRVGRAGAVAVGARKVLIAFNVYLSGRDETAAKQIARAVRESSGGLPAVRAIGFEVPERGCVTVSMNLVDHDVTGVRAAFEAVGMQAETRGMEVLESEIVGLVPRAALVDDDPADLRLEGFDARRQILENLVSAAGGIRGERVDEFLDGLAAAAPTPGGGSAGALAGAIGAALVAMVGRLTIGKQGYELVGARMEEVVRSADDAREAFLTDADRDADAFNAVMTAFKLPKGSDEEKALRSAAIQRAFTSAAEVPLGVARRAVDMLDLARETVETGIASAASDGASAAAALLAATECALANVRINIGSLKDAELAERSGAESGALGERARDVFARTSEAFERRLADG